MIVTAINIQYHIQALNMIILGQNTGRRLGSRSFKTEPTDLNP